MSEPLKVSPDELLRVAQMVDKLCGLVLDKTKGYLIVDRLGPVAEEAGCGSFADLCRKADANQTLQQSIIDAITTQETLFFRDNAPFEALKYKAIPESIDARANTLSPKKLRIWSAACSTGQEPYSIAMTLSEVLPDIHSWDVNVLATDICDSALAKASTGCYRNYEVSRGLPDSMLSKYFQEESDYCRVKDELRYLIHFDRHNLMQSFTKLGPFDIIFCRNVSAYFQKDVKRDLFNRLADRLTPTGYLFVGLSEALNVIDERFVPQTHCRSVYYQSSQGTTTDVP
jgi:chemotaxis protein methyltransferase CheR